MTGIDFLASFIATGRLHGLVTGSPLGEVDRAIPHRFVDVVDEGGESLRRDYGFVEFYFNLNHAGRWVMSGGSIELHRLAFGYDRAAEWARATGVDFPRYVAWKDVQEALGRIPGAPAFKVAAQGGFLEHRAAGVSVIVVDDEEEERGYHAGHGDLWSVSLWTPAPTR
ncbi:hypothetical protein ACFWUZ_00110 [Streptomyces sp. NPDC058646]|uniref:hypothetical protein n=1 Tax=Streptomyces sp. NPDC058646 TaxID=3346574 RepID=UPI00366376DA